MDLILWRHAEAEDAGRGGDLARALTARGREQAERMAAWLAPRLPATALVIVSPAKRCQQTVAALGRAPATVAALGPGATPEALLAAAGWPSAGETVVVVGHQPTIGQAAALAMGAAGSAWQVKKGAVWWLRGSKSGAVRLHAVRSPDDSDL
ncbi:MAG TPA: histidine phosphatase family protein [Caldimonas sp.]|nr:histidine phosphatase family protein [Caldimonas sp.]HEX4234954.1 histidine phosphatase family protein [Caldimonas sp.]